MTNGIPSHDTLQRAFCIIKSEELQNMLVNVLVEIVEKARKELGDYLYKNDELDCYVRDVIAADGKETHNTAKRTVSKMRIEKIFRNLMSFQPNGEYAYLLQRLTKKAMRFQKCRRL